MGISQALFTGVTGLSVNADAMSVTANNIANANAKGFKRDRAEFEDLLSVSLSTGGSIGRGAKLRDVKTMHTQGGLQVTDNLTDIAIQGMGFFVVSNPGAEVQESAGKFFSRVGSLHFDKDGNLVDSNGGRVQGFMADSDGSMTSRLSDVRIQTSQIAPRATQTINLNVNLDARDKVQETEFDMTNPEKSSNFNNTLTVFDSHGRPHATTVYFKRVADVDGEMRWQWHAAVDSNEVMDAVSGEKLHEVASGEVSFDKFGNLKNEETFASEANFNNGALQGQKLNFDFGKSILEGGNGINATTSISAKSTTVYHAQDGYESGNIKSLKIGLDGVVTGIYTNGLQRTIGGIALATFENQDGLMKAGRNLFYSTVDSGPPKIGLPQSGTRGSLYVSSLEESNVDLATEFVNMIMTQRMFQANSRSITTADTMVEEIVNLKR